MSHQVIIADDDMGLLNILSRRLRHLGFEVEEASDGLMASLGLFVGTDTKDVPELIILDVNMPIDDGLSICEVMRREQAFADVPVIVMTGRSDAPTIQRCRELGAHYIHKSGDVWKKLEPLILELTNGGDCVEPSPSADELPPSKLQDSGPGEMNASPMHPAPIRFFDAMPSGSNRQEMKGAGDQDLMSMMLSSSRPPEVADAPMEMKVMATDDSPTETMEMGKGSSSGMPADAQLPKVLLVDDDLELTAAIERRLTESGFDVKRASTCVDGYWTALKEQPDAIVADYVMPDSYGSYLVRRLREHPLTKNIPVIVLTGCDLAGRTTNRSDYSLERQFLNMGADTVLRKPIDHQSLVHEIRRHVHFPIQSMNVERMRETEPCS